MPVHPARTSQRITPRELEVLALVAGGLLDERDRAGALDHRGDGPDAVRRLLSRLGACTRAQAVTIAYRDGLWPRDRMVS